MSSHTQITLGSTAKQLAKAPLGSEGVAAVVRNHDATAGNGAVVGTDSGVTVTGSTGGLLLPGNTAPVAIPLAAGEELWGIAQAGTPIVGVIVTGGGS